LRSSFGILVSSLSSRRSRYDFIASSHTTIRCSSLTWCPCVVSCILLIKALETNGLKIMILLRLSPLIPYNALDYISGVTSIPLRNYSLALIGILPGTILFCFVGATASSLADGSLDASGHRGLRIFTMAFGLIAAFAGVYAASYYSKLELDKVCLLRMHRIGIALSCRQPEYHAHCRNSHRLPTFYSFIQRSYWRNGQETSPMHSRPWRRVTIPLEIQRNRQPSLRK
jgi:hypothetical protein